MEGIEALVSPYCGVYVVYDRKVERIADALVPGVPRMGIDATEKSKTMDTVLAICRWLMEEGAGRRSLLLAVGGGVTSDIAGFAAGIYKRGMKYANVPTTLLSQVDASIGGKTGVNLDSYKNMLGVFLKPEFTFIPPGALETLPDREFLSGAAELLKSFIIRDEGNYAKAVSLLSGGRPDSRDLEPLVRAAAAVKREIVERDPFENGPRMVLNLGHTTAHALEWRFPGRFTHGEAVSIGIVTAARRSEAAGIAARGLADSLAADFASCGLPVDLPCPEEELQPAVGKDKKSGYRVYIRAVGDVIVKNASD